MKNDACLSNVILLIVLLSLGFVAHSTDQTCVHTVYVKTMDSPFAGTTARVTLKLYDNQRNVVEIPDLKKKGIMQEDHEYYQEGNLDIFVIKAKCLATDVCKIELSHNNAGEFPSWLVDTLEVNTAAPFTACTHKHFLIYDWLSAFRPHELTIIKDDCVGTSNDNMNNEESFLHLPKSA